MKNKLNNAFENQKMKKTGNIFTVDSWEIIKATQYKIYIFLIICFLVS